MDDPSIEIQAQQYFQVLLHQLTALQNNQVDAALQEALAALDGLQLIYEEMQSQLEAADVVEQELLQQNQHLVAGYQRYYKLFQTGPIASLMTDPNGLILAANQAIAHLLNIPYHYLPGKPLSVYVAEDDRRTFRNALNQITSSDNIYRWTMRLCPRDGDPVEVNVAVRCDRPESDDPVTLHIILSLPTPPSPHFPVLPPPHSLSLNGLQVLIVDDETDAREFITSVLETQGIQVTAVATAMEALAFLEQNYADVLISDIRMPGTDGYSLIQKVRELEAQRGWHIPAAALTAYLEENREKALWAGYEAHLHKLAQPIELVDMVARLAGRVPM